MKLGMKHNKYIFLALFIGLMLGSVSIFNTPKASAAYVGGRLIDDPIFLNSTSMSTAQIQNFLASKGSYLTNYVSFSTRDNANVSAAQIIAEAAWDYGINPQTILATIQKEESLVTDPTPTSGQINFAMGYGCNDSTGCGKYYGFFNQIDNGTWQLRFNYERSRGNNSWWNPSLGYTNCGNPTQYYTPGLYVGNNVTFKDDYGTPYATFVLENGSTASLYCYTPHAYPGSSRQYFSGSYNFVLSFEQWFGPTAGTFLVKGSGPTVYISYAGTKYAIPSASVLDAYGIAGLGVTPTSDSYLAGLTDGGLLTNNFMIQGDPTVYLADGGRKFGISSGATCTNWGLSCFSNVATISPALASILPSAGVLQPLMNYNGTVFLLSNGTKLPFLSPQALFEHGYNWSNVVGIRSPTNANQTMGVSYPQNNSLVKFASSPAFYYYQDGSFFSIGSFSIYKAWFSAQDTVFSDSISAYNNTQPSVSATLPNIFTFSGKKYVADAYRKIDLSAQVADWPAGQDATTFSYLVNRLPTGVASSNTSWRLQSGAILKLSGNTVRYFASWEDYLSSAGGSQDVYAINSEVLSGLSQGPAILGSGALIKNNSTSAIYVVGTNNIYALSSMQDFISFNLDPSRGRVVDSQTFQYYTQNVKQLPYLAKDSAGLMYILSMDGKKILTNPGILGAWGLNTNQFSNLDDSILSKVRISTVVPNFAYYNGTIYYGQNGEKHPLSSFEKYILLGGNQSNTFSANNSFIIASPTGQSL